MSEPDRHLAHYTRPPLVETVCGIQFGSLAKFSAVHFGEFWDVVKGEYPEIEDQPPLMEVFEGTPPSMLKPAAQMLEKLPLPRVFYKDRTGNFLLQVQPSRFLSNWRKQKESDEYPRFGAAQERFLKGWRNFLEFLSASGIGTPSANQYELSYINHVTGSAGTFPLALAEFLPMFSWITQEEKLPSVLETVVSRVKYALPESKGALYVSISHGTRTTDGAGVAVIDLTARGPAKADWSDLKDWFAVAHECAVLTFTEMTSLNAHTIWGRDHD
ncbi:MAG: TIGR04255 family protein [Candidatus Binatus sp.]|uniref:TIGR04255 family protein n=1 Tax=Candidatus Binatus sp. TaxID=2811406 RepID=UPI00271BF3C2|nr:TIGR04255 family protein [Candidatus Binatus sp.]MDO8433385.1 TIGR04255 family protein [Candidatus Binatus sp.]